MTKRLERTNMNLKALSDEKIIEIWHVETTKAEETDIWDLVAAIEQEMKRRGMDPAAEAQR